MKFAPFVLATACALKLDYEIKKQVDGQLVARDGLHESVSFKNDELVYVVNVNGVDMRLDTYRSDVVVITANTECAPRKGISNYDCHDHDLVLTDFIANDTAPELVWKGPEEGGFTYAKWGHGPLKIGGKQLQDFTYAWATNTTEKMGVLGVGFPANEASAEGKNGQTYNNFPMALKQEGSTQHNVYTMYNSARNKGSIIFGDVQSDKYDGDLTTLKTDEHGRTKLNLISVNNKDIHFNGTAKAVFRGGSAFSLFPKKIVDQFVDAVAGISGEFDDGAEISCLDLDAITINFNFGDDLFAVPLDKFVVKHGDTCLLPVTYSEDDQVVLGDNFLHNYFLRVDQDNKEVALGRVNDDALIMDVDETKQTAPQTNAAPLAHVASGLFALVVLSALFV